MTHDETAQAQARAERFADLVEDTALRDQILRLARAWRQASWDAVWRVPPEARAIPRDRDPLGKDEPGPPDGSIAGRRTQIQR